MRVSRALPLLLALAIPTVALVASERPAVASVSIVIGLDELVGASEMVVVGTAKQRYSVWEDLPSGRRIVTYTRVTVERSLWGQPDTELWVRTLGGVVDKLGQQVSGEPPLDLEQPSVLFLTHAEGALVVTGRAQGHFPLVQDAPDAPRRLKLSPEVGKLLPPRGKGPIRLARDVLRTLTVEEAEKTIRETARRVQRNAKP